jgi:hypothetical protein
VALEGVELGLQGVNVSDDASLFLLRRFKRFESL